MSEGAPSAAPAASTPSTPNSLQSRGDSKPSLNTDATKSPAKGSTNSTDALKSQNDQPAGKSNPPPEEKFTVKVNGKLRTLSRDEAIREIQKASAAGERFEKAAALTKKNQQLLKALADPDPSKRDAAARELGYDVDGVAERRLAERAQRAQMTPEQQRIAELEAQIQERERLSTAEKERLESERTQAEEQRIWQQTEQQYLTAIDSAIKAGTFGANVPASKILYMMADAAEMNLAYGLEIPPEELLSEVKTRMDDARDEMRTTITSTLDGPALIEYLGPDAVNKVVRAAVAQYKNGTQPAAPLPKPAPIAESKEQPKPQWKRPNDFKTEFL